MFTFPVTSTNFIVLWIRFNLIRHIIRIVSSLALKWCSSWLIFVTISFMSIFSCFWSKFSCICRCSLKFSRISVIMMSTIGWSFRCYLFSFIVCRILSFPIKFTSSRPISIFICLWGPILNRIRFI